MKGELLQQSNFEAGDGFSVEVEYEKNVQQSSSYFARLYTKEVPFRAQGRGIDLMRWEAVIDELNAGITSKYLPPDGPALIFLFIAFLSTIFSFVFLTLCILSMISAVFITILSVTVDSGLIWIALFLAVLFPPPLCVSLLAAVLSCVALRARSRKLMGERLQVIARPQEEVLREANEYLVELGFRLRVEDVPSGKFHRSALILTYNPALRMRFNV